MDGTANKNYGVALISIITVLLTGINGLITYVFLMILSRVNFGRDPAIKHGLASGISRMGGTVIVLSVMFGVLFNLYFFDTLTIENLIKEFDGIVLFSVLIGLIGLLEDLSQRLSSIKRLIAMFLLVSLTLIVIPELIPYNLEIFNINGFAVNRYLIFLVTLVMVCGFVNAGNIADGANGLLAGIYLSFFIILYSLDNSIFNFSLLTTLIAFIIYNASTGRIFLGDFGSYLLSAIVAFKSLEIYTLFDVPVFLLASILVYPCFELVRSLLFRLINRASLMSPDNYHLHNYINDYFLSCGCGRHIANSLTGLGIALTSILPVLLYFNSDTDNWVYLFLIEILFFSTTYLYFTKKSKGYLNH